MPFASKGLQFFPASNSPGKPVCTIWSLIMDAPYGASISFTFRRTLVYIRNSNSQVIVSEIMESAAPLLRLHAH